MSQMVMIMEAARSSGCWALVGQAVEVVDAGLRSGRHMAQRQLAVLLSAACEACLAAAASGTAAAGSAAEGPGSAQQGSSFSLQLA